MTGYPRGKNVLTSGDSTVRLFFCEKSSGNGPYIMLMR
nr:MAG TPA: hypothetical protein [Caudoviricetes sp.]